MCINDCIGGSGGSGTLTKPSVIDSLLIKDRVKRDDYDDSEMSKIKFKIGAKYDWKVHARMANQMAAKWRHDY